MNQRPNRTSRQIALGLAVALGILFLPVACGRSQPAFHARGSQGPYGAPPPAGGWSHRTSAGGGDASVGGDGNGFYYYIDGSGTSWTGG